MAATDARGAWVERVLGLTIAAAAPAGSAEPAPQAAGAASPRVTFVQSRLAWDTTRKKVQSELQRLEQTVLAECKDEPDYDAIAGNARILYTITDALDERLIDKLDEALNAQEPQARIALQNEAREIIDEYIDYMASDELLHDVDDNGFVDMQIQATVSEQLRTISANLKALAA